MTTEKCPHCETELPDIPYKEKYSGYQKNDRRVIPIPTRFKCKKCSGWYTYRV